MTDADVTGAPATTEERVVTTRAATRADVNAIYRLICDLASYEKEPDAVEGSAADLEAALFAAHPQVFCEIAEVNGDVAGIALWFVTFSTWKVHHGMWLEDLFVAEPFRRLGVATALMARLREICRERDYPRLEWWVLDWNVSAHQFYRRMGAEPQPDWTTWRLTP